MTGPFPPRPHDPRDRQIVADLGAWEARQFAVDSDKLSYFAPRGYLHLQLWHPARAVSILTPSRITRGRYETWAAGGDRIAMASWRELGEVLRETPLPRPARLTAIERWFVHRHEPAAVLLLRRWWEVSSPRRSRWPA
jgi:hypothetical protein